MTGPNEALSSFGLAFRRGDELHWARLGDGGVTVCQFDDYLGLLRRAERAVDTYEGITMSTLRTRAAGLAAAALMTGGVVTASAGTAAAADNPTQKQISKYAAKSTQFVMLCDWKTMILMDWGHNPFPRRNQLRISLDRCAKELKEVNGWHAQALQRVGRLRGELEAARRQHGRNSTQAKKAEKDLADAIKTAQELEKDIAELQKEIGRIEDRLGDL